MNNNTLKINLIRQEINYYLFGQETFTLHDIKGVKCQSS